MAITGDGARVVMLPPEAVRWAQEVTAPPGAGYLPGSASGLFVGRDDAVLRLREMLSGGGGTVVTQTRAIHGLGGVGKSTLALRYAHRYRDEYTMVWWITAESQERINSGLADLAARLCPQWAGIAGPDERTAWAMLWLQWHPGWLLVYDNVENPTDLGPYLGTLALGHHLATSRRATGWHTIAPTMPLGLLDPTAATDLLIALALDGRRPTAEQRSQAEALAHDLGYLPLALEQAGAYLHQTGTDMEDYRQALGLMLARDDGGIDGERTIARIWDHTLTAITAEDPLAVTVLHTVAWLAPDGLPRSVITHLAPEPRALNLNEALGVLHAYNMVTFTGPDISVHRLVQTVLRTRSQTDADGPPAGRHEAEQTLLLALSPHRDGSFAPPEKWQHLIPHVIALAASTPVGRIPDDVDRAYLFVSEYLHQQESYSRAVPLLRASLAHHEETLGPNHPRTLRSRNNLVVAYDAARDPAQALPLLETTLAHYEEALGPTHPRTLQSRNFVANTHRCAGDLDRAIPLGETVLDQCVRALGTDHPLTVITRDDLAYAYVEAGNPERATSLLELNIAHQEEALGTDDRRTLVSRNNLAYAHRAAGNVERAIQLYAANLAHQERILGPSHSDTLTGRGNLAHAYQAAGDLGRAIALFETALAQREQVLGDSHPDTVTSRNNLAHAYQAAGDLGRAIALFETALAQREQVLGDSHPDTVTSRDNLAQARHAVRSVRHRNTATTSAAADGRQPPATA
ncbi:tetratricopeptide repeat protein [Streptomyces sp. NPDC057445]|uniref:tetratricopeptide repeat protein n=1 Tax=Streptomyces sp. NPDC057445 TaxID=3346136 RepID=UPI0036C2DAC1